MITPVKYIWLNSELVPWDQATVHLLTHGIHYGNGAWEGIRAYELRAGQSAVLRLDDHLKRLARSAQMLGFDLPYSLDQLRQAVIDTLKANGLAQAYIRPIVWRGVGAMGLDARANPLQMAIIVWQWGAYLGEDALEQGVRAQITRYQRPPDLTAGKIAGLYVIGVLAKEEAKRAGFDEAIFLDRYGYVTEGSAENLFVVTRNGTLVTPPPDSVLNGLTRQTVITIAREMGLTVEERNFFPSYFDHAIEAFFTGTAAEITPLVEVDCRTIGLGIRGKVIRQLQEAYQQTVRHEGSFVAGHPEWFEFYSL